MMEQSTAVGRRSEADAGEGDSAAIEVEGLHREFGDRSALAELGFRLEAGRSLAVLGPNGSGKSTLLRILAGLLRPSRGLVSVLGCELPKQTHRLRGRIGYLGHEPLLYRDLNARENLDLAAALHRLDPEAARARIEALLEEVGMERRGGRPRQPSSRPGCDSGSTSAAPCLPEPELLLLDEPDAHLDTDARRLVEPLIAAERGPHPRHRQPRPRGRGRRRGRGAGAGMTPFSALLRKDLRVELRTLRSLPAMALFAVTAFVIFRFGLDRTTLDGELAAGVLVPTILFAALLAINRLFVAEREEGGFDLIRLAPVDRTVLFAAKASALVIYLVVLELIAVPIFALFFLDSVTGLLPLALVLLLADIGLAATGTVISTIATMSSARDLLAPLILLPLLVPLVIAAAGAGEHLLAAGGPDYGRFGTWLGLLGLYDAVFLLVGYATFDFLLED